MSDSQNWYFTAETNAKGYTYIKAYQTKWDPVRKRSHSFNRRHVGRLHDDGRVVPSKAFLEQFPQYAGFPLFYGADKRLVDEETYRRDFPQSGRDRIEILKKPLKTMCLTLVPLGLLRRLPKKLGFFVHWRISSVTHRHANCFISLFTNWTRAAVWPLMANGGRRSILRTPARLAISVSVSCFLRSASRISRNFSGSVMQPSSIKPKLRMSKV